MSQTVQTQPAHAAVPPIVAAEVRKASNHVAVNLLTADGYPLVALTLTPEAALDLSDRIEDAADELIAQSTQKITLEELVEITRPSGDSDA